MARIGTAGAVLAGLAVVPAAAASASLPAACSHAGATVTCTYSSTGSEQVFVVPAGVASVSVTAIGAPGGDDFGSGNLGGAGALVQAAVPVTPGSPLYVEVGQTLDTTTTPPATTPSAFNGGGASGYGGSAGAGGGASDVRTVSAARPDSLGSRLLVAAGGGGAGEVYGENGTNGGDAGSNGEPDAVSGLNGQGGFAGGATTGGAGGAGGAYHGGAGGAGSSGQGGAGAEGTPSAGGGGGGYYGGGGGGGGGLNGATADEGSRAGGGGGGSNFVPTGGRASIDGSRTPRIVIAYTDPNATPPTISGSPTSHATVNSPYAFQYTLTGEPTPTTSVTGGSLPPGLTLSPTGRLSGTPTAAGDYTFTVTATNGVQPDAKSTGTIQVPSPDSTPPTTTASPSGTVGSNGWYTGNVLVTLSAADDAGGSGVRSTSYTLDGGPSTDYATPFAVTGDGTHTLTYSSVDDAGNIEPTHTLSVPIDGTAPVDVTGTPIRSANAYGWYNTPVTVGFTGRDATSGIDSCTRPTYSGPDGAGVTVTGSCSDHAGNTAAGAAKINYDATAPTVAFTGNTGSYPVDRTVSITCAASDTTSGLASSSCPSVSAPAYTLPLGPNTLTASATDKAGNTAGPVGTTFTVTVNATSLGSVISKLVTDPSVAASLRTMATQIATAPNPGAKQNKLNAFTNLVHAQTGKSITSADAATILRLAQAL